METSNKLKWIKKIGIILAGAALGFAYYRFIGCSSGVCPITSNPWISTGYGALIGFLFTGGFKSKPEDKPKETQ
ncbi:hypothetical protein JXJ21_20560 [candidate division KSB1 bacterium]|nr:hypothetical protein [candidate division KSB1 bacterium]